MNMKILAAGAAGALLFGAVAIAQTTSGTTAHDSNTGAHQGTVTPGGGDTDQTGSAGLGGAGTQAGATQSGDATSASEFGSDTAEGTAMDRAGERG